MGCLNQGGFLHFLNRADSHFCSHFCQEDLALLNFTGLGCRSRAKAALIWFKLMVLPLSLTKTASIPRKKNKMMDFGHLGHIIKSGLTGAVSNLVNGVWEGTQISPEAHLWRDQILCPSTGSHRVSSGGSQKHGAGEQAQVQGSSHKSLRERRTRGAPEGSSSAYTQVLVCTGELRANATRQIRLLTNFGRRCLDSDKQSDL